jgi:hypothetical protein
MMLCGELAFCTLSHSFRSTCQYPLSNTKMASLTSEFQAATSRMNRLAADEDDRTGEEDVDLGTTRGKAS